MGKRFVKLHRVTSRRSLLSTTIACTAAARCVRMQSLRTSEGERKNLVFCWFLPLARVIRHFTCAATPDSAARNKTHKLIDNNKFRLVVRTVPSLTIHIWVFLTDFIYAFQTFAIRCAALVSIMIFNTFAAFDTKLHGFVIVFALRCVEWGLARLWPLSG